VLAQWHLPESERGKIPVIQDLSDRNQQIICILGQVFGFDNWIVK
jgi:tRNA(Ile)-lysidine synthase